MNFNLRQINRRSFLLGSAFTSGAVAASLGSPKEERMRK
jgi:alkaline phosphatase D